MRLSLPVSGMLMNQDMKSNYLDRPVGFMEFISGPIQVTKEVTISMLKQSLQLLKNGDGGCKLGRSDFQSPKVDGMMLRV